MAYSPLPEWVRKRKIQERFEETGKSWGGKRPGAGRPRGDRPTAKDAVYVRIFTGSDQIVVFEPQGPRDEASAKQATDYCNWVFRCLSKYCGC